MLLLVSKDGLALLELEGAFAAEAVEVLATTLELEALRAIAEGGVTLVVVMCDEIGFNVAEVALASGLTVMALPRDDVEAETLDSRFGEPPNLSIFRTWWGDSPTLSQIKDVMR